MIPRGPAPDGVSSRLLRWFDAGHRDLPWRHTTDPYRIWVSEIMLQQTQVSRVVPFYLRFIQAFPSIEAVAAARSERLLGLWEGLGYYSRARNLQAACRAIVAQHDGRFPDDFAQARALPGVGEYTAGAVLSIAFGQRLPALDANAKRVLARLCYDETASAADVRDRVDVLGASAVPPDRPGDYNQALMELGALVCTPRRPDCGVCPLARICRAKRSGGHEHALQLLRGGRVSVQQPAGRTAVAAVVVRRRGRVLLAERPETGVWAGMWVFPHAQVGRGETPTDSAAGVLSELGIGHAAMQELARLRYGVMGRAHELVAFTMTPIAGAALPPASPGCRWVRIGDLDAYAMPSPHRKLAAMLQSSRGRQNCSSSLFMRRVL